MILYSKSLLTIHGQLQGMVSSLLVIFRAQELFEEHPRIVLGRFMDFIHLGTWRIFSKHFMGIFLLNYHMDLDLKG
jgi:hypothetical protein